MPHNELIVCTSCRPAGAPRVLPAAGHLLLDAQMEAMVVPSLTGSIDIARLHVRGQACIRSSNRVWTGAMLRAERPGRLLSGILASPPPYDAVAKDLS